MWRGLFGWKIVFFKDFFFANLKFKFSEKSLKFGNQADRLN